MSDMNIEIEENEIYEFEIPDNQFYLEYNKNNDEWSAIYLEEIEEIDYDITFNVDSFDNGFIELFDQYKLSLEVFKKLEETVKKDS